MTHFQTNLDWVHSAWLLQHDNVAFLQVGVNYDPMIAKVITSGPDRQTALTRLHTALSELQVSWCILPCPTSVEHMPA